MGDPEKPPATDHGPDRYGYVEVQGAPRDVSPARQLVDSLLVQACLDCNPNLFLTWRPDGDGNTYSGGPSWWHVKVAHDDGCPTYARLEKEGRLNG